jgi:hypothetical protein
LEVLLIHAVEAGDELSSSPSPTPGGQGSRRSLLPYGMEIMRENQEHNTAAIVVVGKEKRKTSQETQEEERNENDGNKCKIWFLETFERRVAENLLD